MLIDNNKYTETKGTRIWINCKNYKYDMNRS